jgi:DNA-binding response OmpR family regulator
VKDRLLVIEDEPALVRGLVDLFRAEGFDVEAARDGEAGLEAALSGRPDLILLDVMLPRMNGFEICKAVRERDIDVPILILTAKGREDEVVLGLNLGADDYVVKPFRTGELVARVRAFLRRRRGAEPATRRFGDCAVDLRARTVSRNGAPLELTTKEFNLLAFFLERPGRALSRDTILNAVWGTTVFVLPRSIDRCVTTLRAKVEPDPRRPRYIRTIRDVGYRFEPGSMDGEPGDA